MIYLASILNVSFFEFCNVLKPESLFINLVPFKNDATKEKLRHNWYLSRTKQLSKCDSDLHKKYISYCKVVSTYSYNSFNYKYNVSYYLHLF